MANFRKIHHIIIDQNKTYNEVFMIIFKLMEMKNVFWLILMLSSVLRVILFIDDGVISQWFHDIKFDVNDNIPIENAIL